ncbi:MAG: VOC family protein [Ramlibacter sp.]|nr:VOC family protein [Ramlibacter sp.]
MLCQLDHISVIAPSLDAGAAYVEACLGVAPAAGRSHPGMGTHNRLLALGPSVYLEVIAIDPQAAALTRRRWFGLDQMDAGAAPRLGAWVARTDDIAGATTPELGQVEIMRRAEHTWQMAIRPDGAVPLEGAGPLLIQRAPDANPVAALAPSGLHLKQLLIEHPEPDRVRALFKRLQLASDATLSVMPAGRCRLIAEIQTPTGLRRLGEA